MVSSEMKVSIFVPSFSGGGAERAAVYIANHLAALGEHIQFVAAKARGPFRCELADSVPLFDLHSERISRSLPRLVKYLRRERPDVMLSFQTRANILAIIARNFAGSDTRLVVREGNTASASLRDSRLIQNKILYWLIPRLYPQAEAVVAISKGVKDDLAGLLPLKDIHVIYNPAVRADIQQLALQPVEHPFFKAGAPPVILSVGRLTKQKDHTTLLEAFIELRRQIDARLLILGEGDLRKKLEMMVAENNLQDEISLPGFVVNPYAYMSRSAVFVLSSLWEGFGIVLAEAMACGVPVISTDCPSGPAEIVDGGRYGKLVPMGDAKTLAGAMRALIKNPPDKHIGIERAKQFSVARGAEQYLSLFRSLMA